MSCFLYRWLRQLVEFSLHDLDPALIVVEVAGCIVSSSAVRVLCVACGKADCCGFDNPSSKHLQIQVSLRKLMLLHTYMGTLFNLANFSPPNRKLVCNATTGECQAHQSTNSCHGFGSSQGQQYIATFSVDKYDD